ncbi:HAD family hydrolase [Romeria aff. gracilis LEGE 07310]|uniref:HAD family hydrolase n=1 Tax=Vasconcelosia minhoensis LEGE 07310 TaxID=915328 RepID=A0A8J7AJF6_9CYAN|nr:HAD-IIIC family phosphatase [Romeria gracilis]MBE9076500.1 HAD family hydrolase [Romeria aff. gracilis LEGE 07310]
MHDLYWLTQPSQFKAEMSAAKAHDDPYEQLQALGAIAKHNLDFTQTIRLDRRLQSLYKQIDSKAMGLPSIRLAILASATADHLIPSIRVAALRRGLIADLYLAPYGQYRQEILNPASALYQFAPDAVLLALNAAEAGIHLPLGAGENELQDRIAARVEEWAGLWEVITGQLQAVTLHQTMVVPVEQVFGQYDALVPASPANILTQLNQRLRSHAARHKTTLIEIDRLASAVGKQSWCDAPLWHHAKQDVSPIYAPLYGDSVGRVLTAIRGLSRKCLVLDLDNTLWGGVIGDDGLEGIVLGQGSGVGEAYQSFQAYVKLLKERGIILAVCSKNNEETALEPFFHHPEMLLRRDDISIFVSNWEDKATNIRRIAADLNIGLDSLVFFDDNPVERGIVRKYEPAVAVPEVPDDAAWYSRCLSDAGYFETVSFSADDRLRTEQYLANRQRQTLQQKTQSIDGFLAQLEMTMSVAPWDAVSIPRVTQLINKSNQFNLTTRRYTEAQVRQMSQDSDILTWHVRLKDSFGDNGLISVIIARPEQAGDRQSLKIDTWLMSCRVLGRQVEHEVLNLLATYACGQGYDRLVGEYISTPKNSMVREHYLRLGFTLLSEDTDDSGIVHSLWCLELKKFKPTKTFIQSSFDSKESA